MRAIFSGLLALSTLASCNPMVKSPSFQQVPPGCTAGSVYDQKVIFNSGPHRYSVFVPVDDKSYMLGEESEMNLSCINESMSGGPCTKCHIEVDHVQLLNPGTCDVSVMDGHGITRSFNISSTDKQLFFGTPGHPTKIKCQLPPGIPLLGREAASGPLCPDTGGSSVTLGVGVGVINPHKYLMTVPADKSLYKLESPGEQLRCVGPLGDKYSMCLPCDQAINTIQVSQQALTCAFNITGYSYRIVLNAQSTATPYQLERPGKLLDVLCGFPNIIEADTRALAATIREVAQTGAGEVSIPWAFDHISSASLDQSACPSKGYHFTIVSANGNAFFPAFSADGQTHMSQNLPCVSLIDLTCSSCSNAGPATGITAEYQFGPCKVKTQDGRSFEIAHPDQPPKDTNLTPKVSIDPPGIVTEIRCGN